MSGFGYNVLGFGGGGPSPIALDEDFNRVSFLSHFDGANNGVNNAFDDGSADNLTITAAGNVTQGSFSPFSRPEGEWGWSFDRSAEGLVIDYGGTSHNYWNGNFTFEFWVKNSAVLTINTLFSCWLDNGFGTGSYGVTFLADGKVGLANRHSSASNQGPFINCATATNDGEWHHIAITQIDDGGDTKYFRIFVDGVLDGYETETSWTQGTSGQEITMGSTSVIATTYQAHRRYSGHISNWRIVEDIVYSTSSTTIGATIFARPTGPLTAISNTRILTCQSNRFVDNSSNGYGITSHGNGKVTAFGPFLTDAAYDPAVNGASAYFDGAGDYLNTPVNSTFNLSSGNWTIDGWVNNNTIAQDNRVFAIEGGTNSFLLIRPNTDPKFDYNQAGIGSRIDTSNNISYAGEWTHFALVSSSGTITLWINGVSQGTTTTYPDNSDTQITVAASARRYANSSLNGYISDFRVVKGTAVYTSAFTPPTAPTTAITNTKLLLNMANGQAIDSAAQNNLTLHGDANTSTDQAKFGTASLHLDGTGDYAEVASNIGALGTGNFTVEGWYYLTAQAQYDNLFDFRTSGNTSHLDLYFDDDPFRLHVFFGGADRINANAATPTNEWVHIAVVRNGSTTTLYQNGISLGTSTTVTAFTEGALRIGNRYSGDYYMQGYVDDFRISRMARYTANFTAPNRKFPDQGEK